MIAKNQIISVQTTNDATVIRCEAKSPADLFYLLQVLYCSMPQSGRDYLRYLAEEPEEVLDMIEECEKEKIVGRMN